MSYKKEEFTSLFKSFMKIKLSPSYTPSSIRDSKSKLRKFIIESKKK